MMFRGFESLESRRLLASAHFAVIGDYGQPGPNELAVANLVKSWNPDFIVTAGDNSYPTAAANIIDQNIGQYYHEFIYNYHGSYGAGSPTRRFFPAIGNHDWGNIYPGGSATDYVNYFDLPGNERYYDFVQGPVHFFLIDSDQNEPAGTTANSVQGQWLKAGLAAATEPHKVVVMHHPPFSSGSGHGSETRMRWPFAKWGATAVLAGHEHIYERLYEEGIPYFISGLGGASKTGFGTVIAGSQSRYSAQYGAMLIDADDTTMQFKFINIAGTLIDSYTLNLAMQSDLVRSGSDWKYLDNGTNQGTAWRTPGFVESPPWAQGAAQFGYGDGDESTVVSFGSNPMAKRITTYFRKSFNVSNKNAITALNLSTRDDGAVVYLNGTEVFRTNMPGTAIGYTTPASTSVGNADEGNWFATTVSPSLLVNGTNLLAVEIHQSSGTSSDISFDLSLQAIGDLIAPKVTSSEFRHAAHPLSLQFNFSENVRNSFAAQNILLENRTTSETISTSEFDLDWVAGTNHVLVTFPGLPNGGALPDGYYRATIIPTGITDAAGNQMSTNHQMEFYFLNGDANHDARVDISDLNALTTHWGMSSNYEYQVGDFNSDGTVDGLDFGILTSRWQKRLIPPPPELITVATLAPINARSLLRSPMRR